MVHELPPGHHQHRDRVVVEAVVLVHAGRHRARARQREPGGRHAGRGHAVSVVRSQEPVTCHDVMWPSRVTCHDVTCHRDKPVMSVHGRAPVRVFYIVADSLDTPVPSRTEVIVWSCQNLIKDTS